MMKTKKLLLSQGYSDALLFLIELSSKPKKQMKLWCVRSEDMNNCIRAMIYNILSTIFKISILIGCPALVLAQDSEPDFDTEFEKTAQLIVMLKADYDGTEEFGAGIIFGREKSRLLIATASHILHRGTVEPEKILVNLKALPDKVLKATLLKRSDEGGLDLAVIAINELEKEGLDVCSIPFDRLGQPTALKRKDSVYSVGNPNGVPWAISVEPDKISQILGDDIVFQSSFITSGHSGGALVDKNAAIVGMTIADQPPFARAMSIAAVLKKVRGWGYPVQLIPVLPDGIVPLHFAADSGDIDAIKNILNVCGSNVNETDSHNATPLHYAAHNGSIDAISLLLEGGAKKDIRDADGDTPLYWALQEDNVHAVELLIKTGAKINIKNLDGRVGVHWARSLATLKLLIQAGGDVNTSDNYGFTPLQNAATVNDIEQIKFLLNAGADVNKGNEYGNTPLINAVKNQSSEATKILIAAGANVNAKGTFGYTPLMTATIGEWKPGVTMLLKAGADIHATEESGYTPLGLAISHGYPEMATLLRSLGAEY